MYKGNRLWLKLARFQVNCGFQTQLVQKASIHDARTGEDNKLLSYRQQRLKLSIFSLCSNNKMQYIHVHTFFTLT